MKILHVFTLAMTAESFFDGQFACLAAAGYEIHLASATIPSEEFCQRNKITFHQINIARRVDLKADLISTKALIDLIKREKFDAVFGHTPKGALVAMMAAKFSRINNRIYYRHGLIYTTATGIKRSVFKIVEQFTSALATKIVNVSPSLSKLAIADRLNRNRKQIVIGNGTCGGIDAIGVFSPQSITDAEISNIRRNLIGESDFVVGFCGRLCRDKGIEELVEGFKLFKTKHPEIKPKLLLVGPYDQRDILADNIKREIIDNVDIIATGNQEKAQLPALYSLMDVFVFPSYREGFGMCVIEASSMGIPILVSRSHGCIDSILENKTGRYIEITAESIASRLGEMLDVNLRDYLGNGGREFVLNNFDYTVMWPQIIKMYDEELFNKK